MLKESNIAHNIFRHLLFKVADKSLLKTLCRDISYLIHNLSETDDYWCIAKLLDSGIVEAALNLARFFPDHIESVLTCVEAVKNFAYIFQREGISLETLELMESKLIEAIPCIP